MQNMHCLWLFGMALGFTLAGTSLAQEAAGSENSCRSATIVSVPSRPTVTSATDTTECGVAEVEYGLERQWPGNGANRDDLTGGLRFGITPSLDFHWASSDFLHVMDSSGNRTGFGDTWLGLRYRFLKQTRLHPGLGLYYLAKIPSADASQGLGSGLVDHSLSFLASKDMQKIHFDFNLIELFIARCDAPGFDHQTGFALANWYPVTKRISIVLEPYGYTTLNGPAPAFASVTAGFNYKVQPRLYLDSGLDTGVSAGAPRKRIFVGVTYAVANVYRWISPR